MSDIANKLAQAHKLSASASGKLSAMLTRKSLHVSGIAKAQGELRDALEILSSLMTLKGK